MQELGSNPPTILGISQALIGEQYPVWGSTIQERYGETRDGPRRATGMIKGMKKWTYEERLKTLESELRNQVSRYSTSRAHHLRLLLED